MVEVRRSTIINAPVEAVWRVLRDFNDHDKWHPVVADSVIEDGKAADQVGCVRRFHLQDGSELREQLLRLCDRDAQLHLLHPQLADPADRLCRDAHAQARDRWPPHLLGLAIDLPNAAGTRGRARRHGRQERLRGWLRGGAGDRRARCGTRPARDLLAAGGAIRCPRERRRHRRPRHRHQSPWRAGGAALAAHRGAAAGAGRGAPAPHGDRRQLHRRLRAAPASIRC